MRRTLVVVVGLFCAALPLHAAPSARASLGAHQDAPSGTKSEPGFLGVEMGRAEGNGVLVERVVPESAASAAGLAAGDRILGIAGLATDDVDDVRALLGQHSCGESVQIIFRRAQELHVVAAQLGPRPAPTSAPERLVNALLFLQLEPHDVVADIGFGSGWLALGMAEAVGPEGRVYAVEIDDASVRRLRERGLENVTVLHSQPNDVSIPAQTLDQAVLHDVASHVAAKHRAGFYSSIARALRPEGRLVIFGPHGKTRAMLEELAELNFHAENATALARLSDVDLDARLRKGIGLRFQSPR